MLYPFPELFSIKMEVVLDAEQGGYGGYIAQLCTDMLNVVQRQNDATLRANLRFALQRRFHPAHRATAMHTVRRLAGTLIGLVFILNNSGNGYW